MALSDLLAWARDYAQATESGAPESAWTRGTRAQVPTGPAGKGQKTAVACGFQGAWPRWTRWTRDFDVSQGSEGSERAGDISDLAAALDAGAAAAADYTADDPPAPAPPLPELPPQDTAARAALDARHATETAGYIAASRITPPSWWQPTPHMPTPAATCSCCGGRRWWSEAEPDPEAGWGWRCACCHPPAPETVVQMAGQSPVTRDEVGGENGGGR